MLFGRRKAPQQPTQLTFVTRAGCCLCDQALPIVQTLAREFSVQCTVVDVDQDLNWAEYHAHVPVVFVNSEKVSYWVVDEQLLRAKLLAVAGD